MRSLTSLQENRVYSPEKFLIGSAKGLLQQYLHDPEMP
jgi:hypothetical protein